MPTYLASSMKAQTLSVRATLLDCLSDFFSLKESLCWYAPGPGFSYSLQSFMMPSVKVSLGLLENWPFILKFSFQSAIVSYLGPGTNSLLLVYLSMK